jgi:Na+/melibiose symporter-like transporter
MKEGTFYVHGMVYMLVRIAVNVTMTMQPFYLDKVCGFSPTIEDPTPFQLALVPLVSYIVSMIFSIYFQQALTRCLRNRMYPMLLSIVLIAVSSIPLAFLHSDSWVKELVYPLAAIQGLGIAIMLNTGTSLIGDVIGKDAENSAFVYGAYSLFDKFANGILLFIMIDSFSEDEEALRWIMSVVPTFCAIAAYVLVWVG